MSHQFLQLALCRACGEFVKPDEVDCPHCGRNLIMSAVEYQQKKKQALEAAAKLQELLQIED